MVGNLKKAFKMMLQETTWMKNDTVIKAAIDKVDAMGVLIGYPDWIYNTTHLDHRYRDVSFLVPCGFRSIHVHVLSKIHV